MTQDDDLTVTLSMQNWNLLLTLLAKQPYDTVAPLIHAIQQQAQQNTQANVQQAQPGLKQGLTPVA
jgi:hypothetical protein